MSNTAWAAAQLAFANDPLRHSIASAAIPKSSQFDGQDLANLAWSFAYFVKAHCPLLASISSSAIPRISDFEAQNLSTIAWSFAELDGEDIPFLHSISASVLRLRVLPPQSVASLADRCFTVQCHELLFCRLVKLVDRFFELMPRQIDGWRDGSYQRFVSSFGVGNFGAVGTRLLYERLGVVVPDDNFYNRALQHMPRPGRMMGDLYSSHGCGPLFVRVRVLSYAEYEFRFPGRAGVAGSLRGKGVYENGQTAGTRWLVPVQPPSCPFADRGTCSEFRMLTALCEGLARAGLGPGSGQFVTGSLAVWVSGPCCVSCVGAVAQFKLLFPGIGVRLAGGSPPAYLL